MRIFSLDLVPCICYALLKGHPVLQYLSFNLIKHPELLRLWEKSLVPEPKPPVGGFRVWLETAMLSVFEKEWLLRALFFGAQ